MSSLLDKLKPSNRNKVITQKFNLKNENINFDKENQLKVNLSEPSEFDIRIWGIEPIPSSENLNNFGSHSTYNNEWSKIVKQRKQEALHLEMSTSGVYKDYKNNFDESQLSENLEDINNFIEENYQMVLTENIFITNPDLYHSILPFLLIHSKEIHRMSLSDYEIKMVFRQFKNKLKVNRLDAVDYYKIGLINFYMGKFLRAYTNFKLAYNIKKDANIGKWLAFTCLVIIFNFPDQNLDNNKTFEDDNFNKLINIKIRFDNLKNVIINEIKKEKEDEEESFLFGCCQNRKKNVNLNENISLNYSYAYNAYNNQNNFNKNENLSQSIMTQKDLDNSKINKFQLCKETEKILTECLERDKDEKNFIEIQWLIMIISVYKILRPESKVFTQNKIQKDPKLCVKKIKNKDMYLGYLVYAECNLLLDETFNVKPILNELVIKFPQRVEAYLKFWSYLIKKGKLLKEQENGKEKDSHYSEDEFKLAHKLSEVFWKNAASIHFDNNIYYLYITITHAKSLYYLGNDFYTITYFQKEYPANFLYPSIFYLFGKYSSKSKSKSLKNIALSTLNQVYKLLYEDLQNSVLFWIGNVFYNCGNYDKSFKIWKLYLHQSENTFDISEKKLEKITTFMKTYEILGNSINEFKMNLKIIKNENIKSLKYFKNPEKNETFIKEQLNDFFSDLTAIKNLKPNLKDNFNVTYKYFTSLIYFYIERNFDNAIKHFMNLINHCNYHMESYFEIWKILKLKGENRILLNFSYYMLRNSHNSEVSSEDWIKSYIFYSKALFINNKFDEANELLRNMLDIFANIPLDEIKFLKEIHKMNKISTTNNFMNFDYTLSFYSKFHVFKKSQTIFHFNFKNKNFGSNLKKIPFNFKKFNKNKIKKNFSLRSLGIINDEKFNSTKNNISLHGINNETTLILETSIQHHIEPIEHNNETFSMISSLNKEIMNLENLREFNNYEVEIEDLEIENVEKLDEYLCNNINKVEVPEEYTCKINKLYLNI